MFSSSELIAVKNHSYSNVNEINTTHLHLDIAVDFDKKELTGVVRHTMNNTGVNRVIFDMYGLSIEKVTIGEDETETTYTIGEELPTLGAPLIVDIEPTTTVVNIYYSTTDASSALDWLAPELTMSKEHPFLYTQGQAILTRTWIPVQDIPSNRITYSADVKVPLGLLALMSAKNPTEKNDAGSYSFTMDQPIPCYLIAMAVGDIAYQKIGENTGIYSEPALLEEVAYEFTDLQKMVDAAEELYGDYLWETYDVIVLPYSFPFGGMENPRLTFATPTLITGDRSLVSVIAHELAHSWSGNLVTNATWNDFWLNEGFTVYFENRIMEELYGKEVADMLAVIEWQELQATTSEMINNGQAHDTHLKLDLDDRNPDDGMTDIAYVKGAFFLKTLEAAVGRENFDTFLKSYFDTYKFQTLTTEDFITYLDKNLLNKFNIEFNTAEWIYEEGVPENHISISSPRFEAIQLHAKQLKENGTPIPNDLKRENHITQEWLAFIRNFEGQLDPKKMRAIDDQLNLKGSGNAEIMSEWFVLGIHSGYLDIREDMEAFLKKVGRRKFLAPIYSALVKMEDNKSWALNVYKEARNNYHAVSWGTIDEILGYQQ
ncbi:MAG: M1 family metallopeptidase [Crocinitomicaceae bacterium]|nr:M1 family metallopeptidase [Crocinitomicaceae bacterium]